MTPISIAFSVGETLGVDERKFIVSSRRAERVRNAASFKRASAEERRPRQSRLTAASNSDNSSGAGAGATLAPREALGQERAETLLRRQR